MLELANPWMALVAPLPLLIWLLLPAYRERIDAIQIPLFSDIAGAAALTPGRASVVLKRTWLQRILAPVVWALVVTALMRPEWVEPPIVKTLSSRDLLFAIDISQSMETRDFRDPRGRPVSRLDGVKAVMTDFVSRRKGDRLGLILFGANAYLQAPFTLDHHVLLQLLDEAAIGMAGAQTMLGEAIGLAIHVFEDSKAPRRVMILMTDGNDTGSRMPPLRAAGIAHDHGITIYTIVVGNPQTRDERVDMTAMRNISERTSGRAFLALDRVQLTQVYSVLDQIEPVTIKTESYRPRRPLFWIPLALAGLLLVAFHVVMFLATLFQLTVARSQPPAAAAPTSLRS